MNATTTTDGAILEFLSAHPQPIRPLVDRYPKATIYARLRALRADGLVAKRGRQYLVTTAGLQAKAVHEGGQAFDGLMEAYPPLREVPSPQHRALAELEIGALVLRQLTDQEEHHAGFLLVGPSLTWKSSAGRFLCLTAEWTRPCASSTWPPRPGGASGFAGTPRGTSAPSGAS